MEGVGARLGRSSTRYGPAAVFTGPVRKWKKKWIHVATPSSSSSSADNKHHHSNGNSSSSSNNNNNNNNNNEASHILLYKWTPIRKSHDTSTSSNGGDDSKDEIEEPPRRKIKYIPIAVLEDQNNEASTDEAEPAENDPIVPESEPSSKPDMNDMPMEENQVSESIHEEKQELNNNTVGLSLNLNAFDDADGDGDRDGDEESEDQPNDG